MSQHFPNDQCMMIQNYTWVENPFKVQNRPMDFSVTEHERLTDMVSDSTR